MACGNQQVAQESQVTAPSIGLQITRDNCPSVEIQAGMQISWTNMDTVDHVIMMERTDENGMVIESSGTDLLQPDTVFSITLTESGQFTYYCSDDRVEKGTITVLP